MKSLEYYLGFVVGLVIAAAIVYVLRRRIKQKFGKTEYDERQKAVRGECYKVAFWLLVGFLALNGMFCTLTGIEWADPFVMSMTGVLLAIGVFVILCIRKDAYFTMNEQPRFYKRLFLVMIPIVGGSAVAAMWEEGVSLVENGRLCTEIVNFEVALMLLAILIALHTRKEPQEDMEDTDE